MTARAMAIRLAILALSVIALAFVATCGEFRIVIPCTSDSAVAPADTIIRCTTLDSLGRRTP